MSRVSNPSKKKRAAKHSRRRERDETVVYEQRVVPRRVNGKITYEIITVPSHEELFPSLSAFVPSKIRRDAGIQSRTASDVPSATIQGGADVTDIESSECRGYARDEGRSGRRSDRTRFQPEGRYVQASGRPDANGSSSVEDLTQSWDQQMSTGVEPSPACDTDSTDSAAGRRSSASIQKQSTDDVLQQQISEARGLEARTDLVHPSSTVSSYICRYNL